MIQETANFFGSLYRKYRAQNPEAARSYKTLRKNALQRVGYLKRYIKRVGAIQQRLSKVKTRLKRK